MGHGGRALWPHVEHEAVMVQAKMGGQAAVSGDIDHPIDAYACRVITEILEEDLKGQRFEIIYPAGHTGHPFYGLQDLGVVAGWHHTSPFLVGINPVWGSWYAYRAVVLTNSHYQPASMPASPSPCSACRTDDCVVACPVGAVSRDGFDMETCLQYRQTDGSHCQDKCLARMACPVGREHRYRQPQMSYHYHRSLSMLQSMSAD